VVGPPARHPPYPERPPFAARGAHHEHPRPTAAGPRSHHTPPAPCTAAPPRRRRACHK
jgi:hypothetical protein